MTMTMTLTVTDVATIPRIDHDEAMVLAETEFTRTRDLLQQLEPVEWQKQTVCALWDVQALVAHVLGMAGTGGEHIELDALEFGWTLAGRARGGGLLTTSVPF
jgi:hypothetical protein